MSTVPVRFGVNILPLGWGKQPETVVRGNATILAGVSVVKKRPVSPAENVER